MTDLIFDRTWWLRKVVGVTLLCLVTGIAVGRFPPTYIFALVGLGAAVVVALWNRGVLVGIMVLLLLNGVPFFATKLGSSSEHGSGKFTDAIFVALVVLLAFWAFNSYPNMEQKRVGTLAITWSGCYLGWWLFKVVAASPGIPILTAVSYGREFMGFSLLLPLGLLALYRRKHLEGFGFAVGAGAGIFALGQILTQVTHVHIAGLIHIEKLAEFEGVARIFAPMNELLMAVFPMAFAAAVLGPKRYRYGAAVLALLTGLAEGLSFIRAEYVGEIFALIVVSLIWAQGSGWNPRRVRNASYALAVVTVVVVAVSASSTSKGDGTSKSPLQAVASRAVLGLSNLENQSGTTATRLRQANIELEVLGSHWPTGLGFLDPRYHYVPGLREGSIRNDDLGSFSILMSMGLIGLLLAYIPPIAGLIYLLKRRNSFVQYGGAIYIVAALFSSVTLGALATPAGLLVLGSMLIICLNTTALETAQLNCRRTADAPSRSLWITTSAD